MTAHSPTGLPLRPYYADRYVCLDDHRFAHPVNQPSCDCMRRRRPALPFRAFKAVTYAIGFFGGLGGMAVGGWLMNLGERKKERLEKR